MGNVTFKISQLGDAPEIKELNELYKRELEQRDMASNWPDSELYSFAAIYFDGQPLTTVIFAPIESQRKVYIVAAYTCRSWRRLGLYQALMRECINRWRSQDLYDVLRSGYHHKNLISKHIQEKRGATVDEIKPRGVCTLLSLKPTGEEWQMTSENLKDICDKLVEVSG